MSTKNSAETTPSNPAGSSGTAPAKRTRRPLSRKKRFAFSLILLLLTYGLLEFGSWLGIVLTVSPLRYVQDQLHKQAATSVIRGLGHNGERDDRAAIPYEVVHPYLGFVRRPNETELKQSDIQYGLATPTPIRRREQGKALVAIVGGSVAEYFAAEAGDEFARRLEKLPEFAGKKVELIPLGLASYKQPQQLMLINYLMTLGGEFDYIINLDGYNELALTATFNVPHHVFASFPREWNLRVTRAADIETLRIIGRVAYLRESTQHWAVLFDRPYLRSSPLANVIWYSVHRHFQNEANKLYTEFSERQSEHMDYAGTGPQQKFANDRELHDHCTNIWYQSSLQLHQIARSRGIKYFHFLQPNQYLPGSKPINGVELKTAFNEEHDSRPHITHGYPLLIAAGKRLQNEGVRFHDLTQIYATTKDTIYRDSCCHVNGEGNKMLAAAMAEAIGNAK